LGGYGSGRLSGSGRDKVEDHRSIDVNDLQRKGCLKPGWSGSWEWTSDEERVAWIDLRAGEDLLRLSYSVSIHGGDREQVKEAVRLAHVSCRFGGTRPYFICPGLANGSACARRVTKLYGAGRYFLCRRCHQLAYASQGEGASDRSLRRANKVRERLGGDPGMAAEFPPRPKGVWRRTYERLRKQAFDAEMRSDEALSLRAERLLARTGKAKRKRPNPKRSFWR
jgi:hypothetical protein